MRENKNWKRTKHKIENIEKEKKNKGNTLCAFNPTQALLQLKKKICWPAAEHGPLR